jgi:hypothetical protein
LLITYVLFDPETPFAVLSYTGQMEILYEGLIWGPVTGLRDGEGESWFEVAVDAGDRAFLVLVQGTHRLNYEDLKHSIEMVRTYMIPVEHEWRPMLETAATVSISMYGQRTGYIYGYAYVNGERVSHDVFTNAAYFHLGIVQYYERAHSGMRDVHRSLFGDTSRVIADVATTLAYLEGLMGDAEPTPEPEPDAAPEPEPDAAPEPDYEPYEEELDDQIEGEEAGNYEPADTSEDESYDHVVEAYEAVLYAASLPEHPDNISDGSAPTASNRIILWVIILSAPLAAGLVVIAIFFTKRRR